MRKLPIYIVYECAPEFSDYFNRLETFINDFVDSLRKEPTYIETAHLSVMASDKNPNLYLSLTPIFGLSFPYIRLDREAIINTNLKLLYRQIENEIMMPKLIEERKGDYKPIILMFGRINTDSNFINNIKLKYGAKVFFIHFGQLDETKKSDLLFDAVFEAFPDIEELLWKIEGPSCHSCSFTEKTIIESTMLPPPPDFDLDLF